MIRRNPERQKAHRDYLPPVRPCQQDSARFHQVILSSRQITLSPTLESSSLVWATGFAVLLVALQLLPEAWHRALWFDRAAIGGGEYWRILTGNLVHLGWAHLALNVGALLIGPSVLSSPESIAWATARNGRHRQQPGPFLLPDVSGVWACRGRCTAC